MCLKKETNGLVNLKEEYMVLNLSDGFINSTQINNEYTYTKGECYINKDVECNVTALTYCFEIAGWTFPLEPGNFKQPEDRFAKFMIENEEVQNYYKEHFPAMYTEWDKGLRDCYTPLEVHKVLEFGINKWLGCSKADTFYENYPIKEFLKQIYEKRLPIMTSGKFGILNHCVSIVGLRDFNQKDMENYLYGNGKNPEPTIIFDDPWYWFNINTKTYNKNSKGNDNTLPWKQFIEIVKPIGNSTVKYAHIIQKPAATV